MIGHKISTRPAWTSSNLCLLLPLALAAIWLALYAVHPNRPRSMDDAISWLHFFDQSITLAQTRALLAWDFSQGIFFYPPLYPILAAPLLDRLADPLGPVNLVGFVAFGVAFFTLCRCYLRPLPAAALLALTLFGSPMLLQQWVVPWSSTPAAALLMWAALLLHQRGSPARTMLFAAIGCLLLLLRPVEAVAAFVLGIGYAWQRWRDLRGTPRAFLREFAAGIALCVIVLAGYAAFNRHVFGAGVMGAYYLDGLTVRFLPQSILRKFIGIFLDGAVWGERRGALLLWMPWLAPAIVGSAIALASGPFRARFLVAAIVVQVSLYLAYTDFVPMGLWRYSNVHYLKFPIAVVLLTGWIGWSRALHGTLPRRAAAIACAGGAVLLLCLRLSISTTDQAVVPDANGAMAIAMPSGRRLDLVDLPIAPAPLTETGPAAEAVLFTKGTVTIDGRVSNWARDWRLLAAGTQARLLFAEPERGTVLTVSLDPAYALGRDIVRLGTLRVALRAPDWLKPGFWFKTIRDQLRDRP